MNNNWLSEKKVEQKLEKSGATSLLPEHFWLGQYYQRAIFRADYITPSSVVDMIRLTSEGEKIRESCAASLQIPLADITLALYGYFFHHDILIDYEATDITAVMRLLEDDLFCDRIRFPYIWGRQLHDNFNDRPFLSDLECLSNLQAWDLLNSLPLGVFQHGCFVSGPLGIIRSAENRSVPAAPIFTACFAREGTMIKRRAVTFAPAPIEVVDAYAWIDQFLTKQLGTRSEWSRPLSWMNNRQITETRTDYADICPIIGDCVLGKERNSLFECVLKTASGKDIRETMRLMADLKGLKSLPPFELACKLDSAQQLQLLLTLRTDVIVSCLDKSILSGQISIPISEVRTPKKSNPKKNFCFQSEISSLGVRPGHPEPLAAFCAAVIRAYNKTESTHELRWRLESDPSRGLEVTLTDFIRRQGPAESVSKLVLASQPVTTEVCRELNLDLDETIPRTEKTIPRILWKFGFEIARYDDLLATLNRRLQKFEDLLSQIDLRAGEGAREKIRSEGVNLFVSVEAFMDRFIAFNVWLLNTDHWGRSRFEYRVSESRSSVSQVLGDCIQTSDGTVKWRNSGENALGTQLAYLNEFELWLEGLTSGKRQRRVDVEDKKSSDHSGRPFPFVHTQLWADSDAIELQRYKDIFKKIARTIAQADPAGVRNGLDHQRDPERFPSDDALWTCVTRLIAAVRSAEQSRIYPVDYWFDSKVERAIGASDYIYKNGRGEIYTILRPSTVHGLPSLSRIHPLVFAPVNFLGAADSVLFFKLMGESEYSRYWFDYPRLSKLLPEADETQTTEVGEPRGSADISDGLVDSR